MNERKLSLPDPSFDFEIVLAPTFICVSFHASSYFQLSPSHKTKNLLTLLFQIQVSKPLNCND